MWLQRHDRVELPVREQDRTGVLGDRLRRADVSDPMAARSDVDAGRQPCQRIGDHVRDRQVREAEGLAGEAVRIGRGRGGHDGRDARIGGCREDRPDGAHRMARDRRPGDLGSLQERPEGRQRIGAEFAGSSAAAARAGWRRARGRRWSACGTRRRAGRAPAGACDRARIPSRGRGRRRDRGRRRGPG